MTASESGSEWQSIWNDAVANQVAQLNCSSTPTPAPCSASYGLSGANALDLDSVDAGPALPARVAQRLDVHERQPLDCGPVDQPQCAADVHDRGGGGQRDERSRPRDLARHHRRDAMPQLTLTLGQIPQVAYGPVGTTASTAQLTADLQLNDGSPGGQHPALGRPGHGHAQTLTCAYNSMTATDIQPTTTAVTGSISVAGVGVGTSQWRDSTARRRARWVLDQAWCRPRPRRPQTTPTPRRSARPPRPSRPARWSSARCPARSLNGALGPSSRRRGSPWVVPQVADLSTNCGSVSLVQ